MSHPHYIVAQLTPNDRVWIDLKDFEALPMVNAIPAGANVYHEFAKQRLRQMGIPTALVDAGRYSSPSW